MSSESDETENQDDEDINDESSDLNAMLKFNLNDNKQDISIFIEFTGGYSFRQFVEFNKKSVTSMPIFCNSNSIYTYRGNGKRTLITYTEIENKNLTKYIFNENNINTPDSKYHIINLNLDQFYSQIKSLGKKEGLRIYQLKSRPEYAMIQFFGGKTENGWNQIRTEKYEPYTYNINDIEQRNTNNPNITIPLSSFCSVLSSITKLKYSKVTLRSYENGAELISSNETNTTLKIVPWGEIIRSDTKNYYDINIALTELKSLTSISNFHNEGVVRLYCSSDNLVRLEVPLGCYATTHIYLVLPEKIDKK